MRKVRSADSKNRKSSFIHPPRRDRCGMQPDMDFGIRKGAGGGGGAVSCKSLPPVGTSSWRTGLFAGACQKYLDAAAGFPESWSLGGVLVVVFKRRRRRGISAWTALGLMMLVQMRVCTPVGQPDIRRNCLFLPAPRRQGLEQLSS